MQCSGPLLLVLSALGTIEGGGVIVAFSPTASSLSSLVFGQIARGRPPVPAVSAGSSSGSSSTGNDELDEANDLQSALRFLEQRIADGPGTLSAAEISRFEREAAEIIRRMYLEEGGRDPEATPVATSMSTPLSTYARKGWRGDDARRVDRAVPAVTPSQDRQSIPLRTHAYAREGWQGEHVRHKSAAAPAVIPPLEPMSPPLSSYTRRGWRGDDVRPADVRPSPPKEPTSNFAHGEEENPQRPLRRSETSALGASPGYFRKFVGAEHRRDVFPRSGVWTTAPPGARGSLVDTENRVRPLPSTEMPAYVSFRNHRDIGDVKDPALALLRPRASHGPNALVATEGRIRQAPTSRGPAQVRGKDWRSVGDARDKGRLGSSEANRSLSKEERLRPLATTVDAGDYRGPGDARKWSSWTGIPELVAERWGAGGARSLARGAEGSSPWESGRLSEEVRGFRPASPSSGPLRNEKRVAERWGPDHARSLTHRKSLEDLAASSPLATTASLSDTERTSRPVPPSSGPSQEDPGLAERWGPGRARSLTHRKSLEDLTASSPLATTASLSDTERTSRPVPQSAGPSQENPGLAERWGPRNARPLTEHTSATDLAESSPLAAPESLVDKERSRRPAQLSSGQPEKAAGSPLESDKSHRPASPSRGLSRTDQKVADRWGPSVVRSLTHQRSLLDLAASSKLASTASLSGGERSFRPVAQSKDKKGMAPDEVGPPEERRSAFRSLLKEERRAASTAGRGAPAKPPIAARPWPPTPLQELLNAGRRSAGNTAK